MTLVDIEPRNSHDIVYYVLVLSGLPGMRPTVDVLTRHAAHLADLDRQGKLALAGPFLGRSGGLIVLRTANAVEAKRIAEEDPMIRGGFESYDLIPWVQAASRNNYLPNLNGGARP